MRFSTRSMTWCAAVAAALALCAVRPCLAQDAQHEVKQAAEIAAEEEEGAPAPGGPNPLAWDPDLAICTLVVFALLFWILKRFAWPQIAAAIDERERKIAAEIADAKEMNEQAKRLLAEHDAKLAAAAGEVRALLDEARRDAEQTKNAIVAEARQAAEGEKMRAVLEIQRAKEGAIHDLAVTTANVAVDLAKEVIGKQLTSERNNELVRDAMNKLAVAQPSKN